MNMKDECAENNFDPESHNIPYDEVALLYAQHEMKQEKMEVDLEEAKEVYQSLKKLEMRGWDYVFDALGSQPIFVLESMIKILLHAEEYEACSDCNRWKDKVEKTLSGLKRLYAEVIA